MKKLFKFLRNLIVFVYMLLIVLVIVSILSYNNYGVTELGDFTIIPVNNENLHSKFVSGDLLIVNKSEEPKIGDEILFYNENIGKVTVDCSKVKNVDYITSGDYEYTVEDGTNLKSLNFIGKTSTSIVIPKAGSVLEILRSKQGFFYLVVLPLMIAFVYTLILAIVELKRRKTEDSKKLDIDETTKSNADETIESNTEEKTKFNIDETIESNIEEKVNDNFENEIKEENKEKEIEKQDKEKIENESDNISNDTFSEETNAKVENSDGETKTNLKTISYEERKALIQAKLNSMTEEEKKALVQAKLNSMTPEERKAFIEERKRKLESNRGE